MSIDSQNDRSTKKCHIFECPTKPDHSPVANRILPTNLRHRLSSTGGSLIVVVTATCNLFTSETLIDNFQTPSNILQSRINTCIDVFEMPVERSTRVRETGRAFLAMILAASEARLTTTHRIGPDGLVRRHVHVTLSELLFFFTFPAPPSSSRIVLNRLRPKEWRVSR